ncbi:hypothetical protein [Microbulbifer hainanensis]|uniref:hypothetical protein n=1 Tax=Microbulbifer hainanensis TaxID=2735675 RepID=UPI00186608AD|nr:hypothetical protein [Microbulbifer hainanensis]
MTQRRQLGKSQFRLSRGQAVLLLCLFLAVRGLVPAGFMPAPLSAGAPYGFCHGDGNSALLLQWLQRDYPQKQGEHHHHGGHHHDALTAHSFADNHCNFSAVAGLATAPSPDLLLSVSGTALPVPAPATTAALSRDYVLPPGRAPPCFPFA